MLQSTATARTNAGGDAGNPDGKVFITTLGSDTMGASVCANKNTATRNCNEFQ